MTPETQETIKKALEKSFTDGLRHGFKEGLEQGKGFVTHNPDVYGKFQEAYDMILDFAIKANTASFEKFNSLNLLTKPTVLSRNCSYKIGERAVVLFRATHSLCEDGWATVVPILHRSLVECLLNLYLILKEYNDYFAFRFFSHGFLNSIINNEESAEVKAEANREVAKLLQRLSGSDLKKAVEYVDNFTKAGKHKTYWYKPEFVASDLPGNLYTIYKYFSEAVHSSLIGMDLFKDEINKVSINPRNDSSSIKMALVGSMRILFEITNMRIQHETLPLQKESKEALKTIVGLKALM